MQAIFDQMFRFRIHTIDVWFLEYEEIEDTAFQGLGFRFCGGGGGSSSDKGIHEHNRGSGYLCNTIFRQRTDFRFDTIILHSPFLFLKIILPGRVNQLITIAQYLQIGIYDCKHMFLAILSASRFTTEMEIEID